MKSEEIAPRLIKELGTRLHCLELKSARRRKKISSDDLEVLHEVVSRPRQTYLQRYTRNSCFLEGNQVGTRGGAGCFSSNVFGGWTALFFTDNHNIYVCNRTVRMDSQLHSDTCNQTVTISQSHWVNWKESFNHRFGYSNLSWALANNPKLGFCQNIGGCAWGF